LEIKCGLNRCGVVTHRFRCLKCDWDYIAKSKASLHNSDILGSKPSVLISVKVVEAMEVRQMLVCCTCLENKTGLVRQGFDSLGFRFRSKNARFLVHCLSFDVIIHELLQSSCWDQKSDSL
jgi:hypothetical protein